MILVIDNYDSFVYNLVQYLGELGQDIQVFRNDEITTDEVRAKSPDAVMISPGPCTPDEAGVSLKLVRELTGVVPILGICLGHQAIIQALGGRIVRDTVPTHGKTSNIFHDGRTIYEGVANPFVATRYHSLVGEEASLPACLEVAARTDDGTIMGVRHRTHPVEGVQFHPESILTAEGKRILANFLSLTVLTTGKRGSDK